METRTLNHEQSAEFDALFESAMSIVEGAPAMELATKISKALCDKYDINRSDREGVYDVTVEEVAKAIHETILG